MKWQSLKVSKLSIRMNMSALVLFSYITVLSLSCLATGYYVSKKRLTNFCTPDFYTFFIIGFSVLYTVFLTGLNIEYISWFVKISFLVGFFYVVKNVGQNDFTFLKRSNTYPSLFFVVIVLILSQELIYSIIYEPIIDWEARSVWYLRAKQIFFSNGLNSDTGLMTSMFTRTIGHASYPTFMPFLSAFIMNEFGFWNEFLPKTNLFILFIGLLLALISIKRGGVISKILLYIALISVNPTALISGSLDVWVGMYTSVGLIFLMEYVYTKNIICVINGVITFIFIIFFKNDSIILALCMLIGFFVIFAVFKNQQSKLLFRNLSPFSILFLIVLCPVIMWQIHVKSIDIPYAIMPLNKVFNLNAYNMKEYLFFVDFFIYASEYSKFLYGSLIAILLSFFYMIYLKRTKSDYPNLIVIYLICIIGAILFFFSTCLLYFVSNEGMAWNLQYDAIGKREYLVFISLVIFYFVLVDLLEYKNKTLRL